MGGEISPRHEDSPVQPEGGLEPVHGGLRGREAFWGPGGKLSIHPGGNGEAQAGIPGEQDPSRAGVREHDHRTGDGTR